MKRHHAALKRFIRRYIHNMNFIKKKYWNDSNNDRKRRHEPMRRTCYWKCKYKEGIRKFRRCSNCGAEMNGGGEDDKGNS